jgi:ribosomal protein S27AE
MNDPSWVGLSEADYYGWPDVGDRCPECKEGIVVDSNEDEKLHCKKCGWESEEE